MKWFTAIVLFVQRVFLGFEPLRKTGEEELPPALQPVFIIGAPRSGSTLLFQLLVRHYRVAFISNLMALFPRWLSHLARLTAGQTRQAGEIRESKWGYVPGLHSPNEAGAVMRLWFRHPLTARQRRQVRQCVARISKYAGGPLVFKNLNNSLRLENILDVFPQARIVYLKRDPRFNAQSIVMARRKLGIGEDAWWSVAPEGYEELLGQPLLHQAAWQVQQVDAAVRAALRSARKPCIELNYEVLTRNPEPVLDRLARQLELHAREGIAPSFSSVRSSEAVRLSKVEWEALQRLLKK